MTNINELQEYKDNLTPISMVTCYDYSSAKIIDSTKIDTVLVGDSVAMVIHGYESTINASVDMIRTHVKAVRKGTKKFLIADLPFLAHQKGKSYLVKSVDKLMKAGAQAIKIEGTKGTLDSIKTLVDSGIPIFGHLGLTPQSVNKFGGYKVQGKSESEYDIILQQAISLQSAGCSAIVLELVPTDLAKEITEKLKIPTIGIGAGPNTSGQVLVFQDLLGMNNGFNPKFLKTYLSGYDLIANSLNTYNSEVKERLFPSKNESF